MQQLRKLQGVSGFLEEMIEIERVPFLRLLTPRSIVNHGCELILNTIAARASAGQTYGPLFLGVNVMFLLIKVIKYSSSTYTIWSYMGILLLLGLNWFCYTNILESAASSTAQQLEGFCGPCTSLWSPKVYNVLSIVPLWGAYNLYHTLKGGRISQIPNHTENGQNQPSDASEKLQGRRQARAEKQQQKRINQWVFEMMGSDSGGN